VNLDAACLPAQKIKKGILSKKEAKGSGRFAWHIPGKVLS
jgi:hypothetical protein